jgi:hypothetical protein
MDTIVELKSFHPSSSVSSSPSFIRLKLSITPCTQECTILLSSPKTASWKARLSSRLDPALNRHLTSQRRRALGPVRSIATRSKTPWQTAGNGDDGSAIRSGYIRISHNSRMDINTSQNLIGRGDGRRIIPYSLERYAP